MSAQKPFQVEMESFATSKGHDVEALRETYLGRYLFGDPPSGPDSPMASPSDSTPLAGKKRQPKVDARKRRKSPRTLDRLGGMVRRGIRAYGREIAEGDVSALKDLLAFRQDLDRAAAAGVAGLRAKGYSWADIGRELGMSKQAVEKRWGGQQ